MATLNVDTQTVLAGIITFLLDNHVVDAVGDINIDAHATDGTCSIAFTVRNDSKYGIGSCRGDFNKYDASIGSTVLTS